MLPLLATLASSVSLIHAAPLTVDLDAPAARVAPEVVGAIGLRTRDNRLWTLRVDDLDGLILVSSGVQVYRPDGWWQVHTGTTSDGATTVGWTLAGPVGPLPSVPLADPGCGMPDPAGLTHYNSRTMLLHVSPALLVTETIGEADCGGAHGAAWDELESASLSAGTTFTGRAVDEVFGAEAERLWREAGARARALDDQPDCFQPEPTQWGLVRAQGRWTLRGRLHYGPEVCRGMALDYTVPVAVPRALTGPDNLPAPWASLVAAHPGLRDALASPDGRMLLLVDAGGVTLTVDGLDIDRMELPGATVVAAQWATGAEAAGWMGEGSPLAVGRYAD